MNEKKNFSRRVSSGDKRRDRNTFKDVKEFFSSCDTVVRNEKLDHSKNVRANIDDSYSSATNEFRLSDNGDGTGFKQINDPSFNFNSNFSKKTNSASDSFGNKEKSAGKPEVPSTPKSSNRVGHLPFRTISQETIANISKKIGKIKERVISTDSSSTGAIAGNSGGKTFKKSLVESKPSPIIMPKEHVQVLQERIRSEIQNLKCLESSGQDKDEEKKMTDEGSDDDFEELGSDIQFLPIEERERLEKKYFKDEKKSKLPKQVTNQSSLQAEKQVVTIDLTKDLSPCEIVEKTEVEAENDYPSLDLDYGAKINWDDGEKSREVKLSTTFEKPIINLDIDESKLTVETTRKIEDIKNRLGRSLSIGLTHKETEKETSSESTNSKGINALDPVGRESSNEDAETLELASLRCTSERTEVIADRERRRKRRCADYPGLAFGFSIFSSDTMMKFNIIRNELHNIMNTQLKRVRISYIFIIYFTLFIISVQLAIKLSASRILDVNFLYLNRT